MTDRPKMRDIIAPKSDQLNYDDVMTGPITVQIQDVQIVGGEQPVNIIIQGRQPYKPCKSMLRILCTVWGEDETQWVGRYMTLYGDPTVKWVGQEVGGIRISHLSHMERPLNIKLTATRGKRKPYTVEPLQAPQPANADSRAQKCREWLTAQGIAVSDAETMIGKPLESATDADFAKIGTMKPE